MNDQKPTHPVWLLNHAVLKFFRSSSPPLWLSYPQVENIATHAMGSLTSQFHKVNSPHGNFINWYLLPLTFF